MSRPLKTSSSAPFPEILAPAGDETCMRAAIGAGADAVYFGLQTGFNARMRRGNFTEDELPRIFELLHSKGVKGYVTFNTLVYDSEFEAAERCLSRIAQAGADAIIVQDLGVARFAHALAPDLPLHASTQMTVSSAQGAMIAQELGIRRVVVPRELSVEEIGKLASKTDLELEVFVHGALCVSWSGQCLTSEAWGQRSANRGQCAQSCRLPYGLVVDGEFQSTGIEEYLLSPKDLAAHEMLPDLAQAGVSAFKIEGRYKSAEYVAATVEKYRKVRDAWSEGRRHVLDREDRDEMGLTFTRGFSTGWLGGTDHQELSHGLYPGHRGLHVGEVERVAGWSVFVRLDPDSPDVKHGDWMVFDQGDPEDKELCGGTFAAEEPVNGVQELRFGNPGPNLKRLRPGDGVWKSHDSALKRRLLRYVDTDRKVGLDVVVRGAPGHKLEVAGLDVFGRAATVVGAAPLEAAEEQGLSEEIFRSKFGALGETRFVLRAVDLKLESPVAARPSDLKKLRRQLVESLESQPVPVASHAVGEVSIESVAPVLPSRVVDGPPELVPLCRTIEQVDAVLAAGCAEVYLDFMELVGLGDAVKRCRAAGARTVIATMRIQKPGEEPFDKRFEKLAPDGILARHLGALHHYRSRLSDTFSLHGDFSLNAANVVTGRTLLSLGLQTLTPSYDLNLSQLEDLAAGLPAERLEVTIHQHLPLYHTEYCVYAHHLSDGKDWRDCGRPCEEHRVALRDQKALEHPVLVDVGCRNTVFNAKAQSAAPHAAALLAAGIKRFRVEFVWETAEETTRVIEAYRALLEGRKPAAEVARDVGAIERYGVTSGTLAVLQSR